MEPPEPWPLRHLVLRTPRLELRPDDDAGLLELAEEARLGVHPPDRMPFLHPWTDADPRYLGRGVLQYHWQRRSALSPENWSVHFLVRHEGRVVGTQELAAESFAVTREVVSGSWLGMRHQGRGFGTEMRAAVLLFAFDVLGARAARSSAFADNAVSLRVSAKLGYRPDGTQLRSRRGEPVVDTRLVLEPGDFVRPPWKPATEGAEACLDLLGAS